MYGFNYSADRATHTWSYNGASTLMYVNGGKVWAVDLRVGMSHVPRQASATKDACGVSPYSSLLQSLVRNHLATGERLFTLL